MGLQNFEDANSVAIVANSILAPLEVTTITRVPEGVSTAVFRVDTTAEQFYLRVNPEPDASFAGEDEAHRKLHRLGVRVPEVVYFEERNPLLQRSVMMTKAVPGRAIGYEDQPESTPEVLRMAGRDLRIINQIPVEGFGWVTSVSKSNELRAEFETAQDWLDAHFDEPFRALADSGLWTTLQLDSLLTMLESAACFGRSGAFLAHGDFDFTHIFYDESGYAGIIDFGEIRGAHRVYDLGHFAIAGGGALRWLIEGYEEVAPLDQQAENDIRLTGCIIAARRIGRALMQGRAAHPQDVSFLRTTIDGR
jgi:aminoglycoside phosphotransferase (APT) family kinase protein